LRCSFNPQGWLKDGTYSREHKNVSAVILYPTKQNDSGTYVCQSKSAFPKKVVYQHIFNVYIGGISILPFKCIVTIKPTKYSITNTNPLVSCGLPNPKLVSLVRLFTQSLRGEMVWSNAHTLLLTLTQPWGGAVNLDHV